MPATKNELEDFDRRFQEKYGRGPLDIQTQESKALNIKSTIPVQPSTSATATKTELDNFDKKFREKYGRNPLNIQTTESRRIQTPYATHLDNLTQAGAASLPNSSLERIVPGQDIQLKPLQEQYDTASRRLNTLRQHQNDLAFHSATMDPTEYSRQWNETQKQIEQMKSLQGSAANRLYYENNQAQLGRIQNSETAAIYEAGRNAKKDQQTILQLMAPNAQNQPGYTEAVQKISEAYGISPQTSGTDYQQRLQELYNQLEDTRKKSRRSVNAAGFDYDRLEEYEERIQADAENAKARENVRAFAKEHPVAASALSVAVQPAAGLDYLQQVIGNLGRNDTGDLDTYRPMSAGSMTISNFVSDIRGSVSEEIEKNTDWDLFGKNIASFLYQTGMSVADTLFLAHALGGSGASFLLGMSASAQQTSDALSRGANSQQALLAGFAAGAAEMLFEKFSIDQLLKPKSVTSVKRLLQETMKQVGVEASEEGATEIANILTDAAIMGESSDFSVTVENYKAQGMSESEAKKQAYLDMIGQVGWAAAGGALSGGVMGGFVNTARLGLGNQTENTAEPGTDRQGQARQKMAQPNVIQSNSGMPWAGSDTSQSADSRLEQSQQKQSEARFSIQYDRNNNPYVLVEDDILEGVPRNEWVRTVKDNLRQRFPNGVTVGNNVININQQSRREMTFSNYMKQLLWQEPQLYSDKLRATNNADEILRASRNWVNEALLHRRKDTITDFARGEVLLRIGNNDYRAQVVVGNRGNGNLLLYDIINLVPTEIQLRKTKVDAADTTNTPKEPRGRQTASTRFNVAQDGSGVNGNLAFRQTGERTELPPLRSRVDNTNSSSGVLWAGSESGRLQAGLAAGEYNAALSRRERRVLDQLAKDLGVQVQMEAPAGGQANGWYQDGVIHIAADAEDPFLVVGAHEITHRMQELAPEEYRRYRDYAVGRALEETDGLVEQYRERYAKAGVELRIEEAMDEIAADYTSRMVEEPELFEQMARDDRSLARRILDALLDFLELVRARFSSQQSRNEASQAVYGTDLQTLEEAARLWRRAYDAASQQASGQTENAFRPGGAAQFSIRTMDGKNVVWIENSSLTNKELNNHKAVADFIAQHIGEVYTIIESGQKVYIGPDLPGEYTQSRYTSYLRNTDRAGVRAKNKAVDGLGELIETATNRRWEQTRHTQSKDAKYGMYRYDSTFAFPIKGNDGAVQRVRAYDAELLIRNASDGKKYLYDIVNLKENTSAQIDLTKRRARSAAYKAATGRGVSNTNIAESGGAVNGNLSLGERDGKTDIQLAFERAMAEKRRIRFSLKTPIEGSADLIALHNLTERNLLDALRLGGLPMPSIAVTKVGLPHLEYGPITLILDKGTIDPEADRRNLVYGADIESPTIEHAGEAQTLEEIVEAMKRGKHLPAGLGPLSLQSVAAPRYESLEEIRQDSGRLRQMAGPEYESELAAVKRQIREILREVGQEPDEVMTGAALVMLEAAAGRWTEEAITERFAEAGYQLDEETVRQIQEVYKAAAELPVEYFEAKPERAIGFEEIVAAVVPDDSSEELLERLKEAGVRTVQYQTWDDGDRVDKVNEIQEARFSLKKKEGRGRKANSDSGVFWAGSETAMDRPAAAEYNEAGKGQSTSSSNSSSGILWAGSDAVSVVEDREIRKTKSEDIKFGSDVKSEQKLNNQMKKRGWDERSIRNTVDSPYTTRRSINRAMGNPSTVYYTEKGSYVIVDDITKEIVQISDNVNPASWVPDPSIVNPYIP